MLTKKYYKQIAEVIKQSENKKEIINGLSKLFYEYNTKFDIIRFKKACEE